MARCVRAKERVQALSHNPSGVSTLMPSGPPIELHLTEVPLSNITALALRGFEPLLPLKAKKKKCLCFPNRQSKPFHGR